MPYRVTQAFSFDAGHRIVGHTGKCLFLHGHSYQAIITMEGVENDVLDRLGMVIDFGKSKKIIKGWIDGNWDHNMILNSLDPIFDFGLYHQNVIFGLGKRPYVMYEMNPTAENMAQILFDILNDLLRPLETKVVSVQIRETDKCWAQFTSEVM